jgi:hypothetical protein
MWLHDIFKNYWYGKNDDHNTSQRFIGILQFVEWVDYMCEGQRWQYVHPCINYLFYIKMFFFTIVGPWFEGHVLVMHLARHANMLIMIEMYVLALGRLV